MNLLRLKHPYTVTLPSGFQHCLEVCLPPPSQTVTGMHKLIVLITHLVVTTLLHPKQCINTLIRTSAEDFNNTVTYSADEEMDNP